LSHSCSYGVAKHNKMFCFPWKQTHCGVDSESSAMGSVHPSLPAGYAARLMSCEDEFSDFPETLISGIFKNLHEIGFRHFFLYVYVRCVRYWRKNQQGKRWHPASKNTDRCWAGAGGIRTALFPLRRMHWNRGVWVWT
jgi:hypothetical protein